jgi:hypothetical protein
MWRLTVYVAPEHLLGHEKIAEAAGQVVFKTVDVHGHFESRPESFWRNDTNLQAELKSKLDPLQIAARPFDSHLSPLAELIGNLSDQLLESGQLTNLPSDFVGYPPRVPKETRERIESALLYALNGEVSAEVPKPIEISVDDRGERLIQLLRSQSKRLKHDDISDFKRRYSSALTELSPKGFDEVFAQMETAVLETGRLDQRGGAVHKGYRFNEFREVLDEVLRKHGVAALPRSTNDLFGESK